MKSLSQETPVMKAERQLRYELQAASTSTLPVYIFHRKMVELTPPEFLAIRELLMNMVSDITE